MLYGDSRLKRHSSLGNGHVPVLCAFWWGKRELARPKSQREKGRESSLRDATLVSCMFVMGAEEDKSGRDREEKDLVRTA